MEFKPYFYQTHILRQRFPKCYNFIYLRFERRLMTEKAYKEWLQNEYIKKKKSL